MSKVRRMQRSLALHSELEEGLLHPQGRKEPELIGLTL